MFSVVPFLRLFLIVLERLVVTQARSHHAHAAAAIGAGKMVLNLVMVWYRMDPRHGIGWIAARAIVNGSIAAPAAL
ncbi:hypothetical protein [Mesorhizobium sp. M1396]|uniref:hypothetical protein n=1 Tax=Mesorhizobium sp. M1396 TaxID=2957095 RepID=UPI00333BEC88